MSEQTNTENAPETRAAGSGSAPLGIEDSAAAGRASAGVATAIVSMHEAVWNWLASEGSATRLFFNFSDTRDGATCIQPTDTLIEEYLDGTQLRRYAVELTRFMPVTFDANDKGNIDMLEEIDAIIEWIKSQQGTRSYPSFPSGMQITEIRVLETEAGYAVESDGTTAKYVLPFSIEYLRG